MIADIEPDIIGITESWAHKDMVDAELMLSGYVMFRIQTKYARFLACASFVITGNSEGGASFVLAGGDFPDVEGLG